MRIGIDFDNTIICYDKVFPHVAKKLGFDVPMQTKQEVRDYFRGLDAGEKLWMRLQGKVYGEYINLAEMYDGFLEFTYAAKQQAVVELFIVSHKTQYGHFDEKQIDLRDAAMSWLRDNCLLDVAAPVIPDKNIFFAPTRNDKINLIKELKCTHFIDDLEEVLFSPLFPDEIERLHFVPAGETKQLTPMQYTNWKDIKNALF